MPVNVHEARLGGSNLGVHRAARGNPTPTWVTCKQRPPAGASAATVLTRVLALAVLASGCKRPPQRQQASVHGLSGFLLMDGLAVA